MRAKAPWLSASSLAQIGAIAGGIAVFIFLMIFSIAPYFASRPGRGASEPEFKAELDRFVPRALHHYGIPGVVISTVIDGTPAQTYAYGYANAAEKRAMTPDTVFRVASISKSLTAWGVLRLVEGGKIKLDGPVERYLRAWPLPPSTFSSKGVTVRRLLNHTAGLSPGADTFRRPDQSAQTPREVMRRSLPGTLPPMIVQPAGRAFRYSVPGYMMLQMLIEDQTHHPFADYMKNAVLLPLGMTSSSFDWDPALRPRTATPDVSDQGPAPIDVPQDQAADSLFTTAPDLARFIAAPLPDKMLPAGAGVLSAQSVRELYSDPASIPSLQLAGFGPDLPTLGYFVERVPNQPTIVTNGGYDPGWSSRFYMVPATGDGVAILTNSDRAQPVIAQIASIWSVWRGLPPTDMTRTYRTLGVEADAALSLVVMLSLSLAAGLLLEVKSDAKRRWAFKRMAIAASALESVLAISVVAIWLFAGPAVRAMPTLNAVGATAISFFALVVLARLLLPVRSGYDPQPPPKPRPKPHLIEMRSKL